MFVVGQGVEQKRSKIVLLKADCILLDAKQKEAPTQSYLAGKKY